MASACIVKLASINYNKCSRSDTKSKLIPHDVADQIRLVAEATIFQNQSDSFIFESNSTAPSAQITEFVEPHDDFTVAVDSNMDNTRYATADAQTNLQDFFMRPVEIQGFDWAVGGELDVTINPWTLWSQNPRVANRLTNYRNFKGKLHVKYMLNGNQFYWGKAFVSYTPFNESAYVRHTNDILSIMPALQRPHIWLDPSSSQGGDLILPFFWPGDNVDLIAADPFAQMGQLWVKSLVNLSQAMSLTTFPVHVTVYAWCEGVELSSPTQVDMGGLTPQADEFSASGPISKPASIAAKIAGKLSAIPSIAPYARATQMAASGVASVASYFGYSRPRVIEEENIVKIWQTGDIASTDQKDTVATLAMTSKQEITIDPRTTGLGSTDELTFDHLNSIPSYLTKTTWELSDNKHQPLISIPVTPMLYNVGTLAFPVSSEGFGFTTTAFTATPFQYWRGSMTFRFQLAASGYHKGRLLLVWDPASPNATPEINTVYSKIIDLETERDFSITIGWGNPEPALSVQNPFILAAPTSTYAIRGLYTDLKANGSLSLYVLNSLVTSGPEQAPVEILVHTHSKDMTYWNPESERLKTFTYVPQVPASRTFEPQTEESDANDPTMVDAPTQAANLGALGGKEIPVCHSFLSGEAINTFRTCLKRYSLIRRLSWYNPNMPATSVVTFSSQCNGYFPVRAYNVDTVRFPGTLHAYVSSAYSGWRGSTRVRIIPAIEQSQSLDVDVGSPKIARFENAAWGDPETMTAALSVTAFDEHAYTKDQSWSGTQVTNDAAGGVLAVELPYYAAERFATTGRSPSNTSASLGAEFDVSAVNKGTTPASLFVSWDLYMNVGEDYNLFFFLGVPAIWRYL